MRKFILNKVVRDGVFADMQAKGQQPRYRILEGEAAEAALIDKIIEEANELKAGGGDSELVDLQEALEQLAMLRSLSVAGLQAAQAEKRAKVGGFGGLVFVETLELQDDDPWAGYYAANPERFPEIKKD